MPAAALAPTRMGFDQIAVLAVSAMAQVELCRIVEGEPRGAIVAVKRLPHDVVEDPELLKMFQDEIWMAAALDHPNIARVIAWGEDERGPFLVSEFVHGVPLGRLMRTVFTTGERFTERLVIYLASCVSAGLASAHELRGPDGEFLGLVHRDLTPGNVLLGFDGSVKITDFGLAKAKQRVTHTAVGMTKGDPAYMSPEQVLGRGLDGRSDIFALGVVMYELFAQELPWRIRSVRDALDAIVNGPAPDLARPCPRVDSAIIEMVNRCVAKSVEERYPTVHVLQGELARWLELHGYAESRDHLARFVRRNAMRQMRWIERVLGGEEGPEGRADETFAAMSDAEGSSESSLLSPPGGVPLTIGPGRVVGSEDDTAPPIPPPPRPRKQQLIAPPTSEVSTARRPPSPAISIDDPETMPGMSTIEDPESAPTTIDRPRPRLGTVTLTTTRARDAEPPMGAIAATLALGREAEEPATARRGVSPAQLMVVAARIIDGAEELSAIARAAASDAREAAQLALAAAERAERGAEAVRLVHEAVQALERGDGAQAASLLERATRLVDGG